MPEVTLDVLATRRGGIVNIAIEYQGQRVNRSLFVDEVNTPEKVVQWALAQQFPADEILTEVQKRIRATVHQEVDEEGNQFWVIDSIDEVGALPEDGFDDWVEVNVVDLASAREALKMLAGYVRKLRV